MSSTCPTNSLSDEPTVNEIEFYNSNYTEKKAEYNGKACIEYNSELNIYYFTPYQSEITLFDISITENSYSGAIKFITTNNQSLATYSISEDKKMVSYFYDIEINQTKNPTTSLSSSDTTYNTSSSDTIHNTLSSSDTTYNTSLSSENIDQNKTIIDNQSSSNSNKLLPYGTSIIILFLILI